MLKTIFTKTLYEKRWMMLFWFIGVGVMAFITMTIYPSFREGGFDQLVQNVPKPLQAIIGNIADNKNIPGFIGQQIFAFRIPLVTLVFGIILFGGLLAGDEGDGTLQTVLAQPVSRSRVYVEKFLAGLVISLVVCAGAILGILLGLMLVNESFNLVRLLQSILNVWLLTLSFGSIAFAIGAITGKRGTAGGVAGLFTFGSYLISSLAVNVTSLEPFQKFTPFHYYNQPAVAVSGQSASNTLTLTGIVLVLTVISWFIFTRRDIYQR